MGKGVLYKVFFGLVVCVAFAAAALQAGKVYGADPATVKIGYVDLRVALVESEAGKKAKAEMESMVKTKQAAIEEKGKAIEKLKGEIEKQAAVLSPEAKKSKEDEADRMMRDFQRLTQDAQAEVKKKEADLTGTILKDIKDVIDKIGQENDYSLILENFEGMILYAKKDLDITDKVIKRYNESKAAPKK